MSILKYDIIISINVHEKPRFLLKQINNIKKYVKCNYAIILNCNYYMYQQCSTINYPNIYINPKPLNKRTFHGSLTEGIYNNMCYSLHFQFDYFIVASSRNFFDNFLTLDLLHEVALKNTLKESMGVNHKYFKEIINTWFWNRLINTKFLKYILEKNLKLSSCPHEVVVYPYSSCKKIISFMNDNPEIKNELFNFNMQVEEFAMQTIVKNMDDNFYYIGNGCCTNEPNGINNELRFMYKTYRV
jgi:hypothetical protein